MKQTTDDNVPMRKPTLNEDLQITYEYYRDDIKISIEQGKELKEQVETLKKTRMDELEQRLTDKLPWTNTADIDLEKAEDKRMELVLRFHNKNICKKHLLELHENDVDFYIDFFRDAIVIPLGW